MGIAIFKQTRMSSDSPSSVRAGWFRCSVSQVSKTSSTLKVLTLSTFDMREVPYLVGFWSASKHLAPCERIEMQPLRLKRSGFSILGFARMDMKWECGSRDVWIMEFVGVKPRQTAYPGDHFQFFCIFRLDLERPAKPSKNRGGVSSHLDGQFLKWDFGHNFSFPLIYFHGRNFLSSWFPTGKLTCE